jgi:hypothetical protein
LAAFHGVSVFLVFLERRQSARGQCAAQGQSQSLQAPHDQPPDDWPPVVYPSTRRASRRATDPTNDVKNMQVHVFYVVRRIEASAEKAGVTS